MSGLDNSSYSVNKVGSGTYLLGINDYIILAVSSNTQIMNLPLVANTPVGRVYIVSNVSSAGPVILTASGSDQQDGGLTPVSIPVGKAVTYVNAGNAGWWTVDRNF